MCRTITCLILVLAAACRPGAAQDPTRIVLVAGDKSHPPAMHEYLKTVRLLRVMLEEAPIPGGIEAEIVYGGWPDDEAVFDEADAIFFTSDGQDGPIGRLVPYMHPERMVVMRRLMARGVGLVTFHFATFAPDSLAPEVLAWTGGYFDWQNDRGEREWHSKIETVETDLTLPSPSHPITRGVRPFRLLDEYYFDIRFPDDTAGWTPILAAPALPSAHPAGDVVAWAVERPDGGRGFATTTGHFYADWKHPEYRTLMLNALVWAAGLEVPVGGVPSRFYTDAEVTRRLTGAPAKGLVLAPSGCVAPMRSVATRLSQAGVLAIDAAQDLNMLSQYDLRDYAFIALARCPGTPAPVLEPEARTALERYLRDGGGLLLLGVEFEFAGSAPVDIDGGASGWSYASFGRGRLVIAPGDGVEPASGPSLEHAAAWLLAGYELWNDL